MRQGSPFPKPAHPLITPIIQRIGRAPGRPPPLIFGGLRPLILMEAKDMLSVGLSVLFTVLIGIFGPLVGLILVAYILGAITGGWLVYNHDSALH